MSRERKGGEGVRGGQKRHKTTLEKFHTRQRCSDIVYATLPKVDSFFPLLNCLNLYCRLVHWVKIQESARFPLNDQHFLRGFAQFWT